MQRSACEGSGFTLTFLHCIAGRAKACPAQNWSASTCLRPSQPPACSPGLHLVLYEGEQWRDDQRKAGAAQQRGQLVAQALAAAAGHQAQHVPALQGRGQHRTEGRVCPCTSYHSWSNMLL